MKTIYKVLKSLSRDQNLSTNSDFHTEQKKKNIVKKLFGTMSTKMCIEKKVANLRNNSN